MYSLHKIFSKAIDNGLTPIDINTLIDIAFKMAANNLRLLHKRIHRLIIHEQLTIENIAIDAIAPLFICNKEGILNQITEVYTSWQPKIEDDEAAIYFFNKLISKRVEQHISFLLRESDPFFSKILDSINYLVKKNGYKKIHSLGSTYILPPDCEIITGDVLSQQDIDTLPSNLFKDKKKILENIFDYIRTETKYFPAIHLNALTFRIKLLNFELYKPGDTLNDFPDKLEIDSITKNALNLTYEKLDESYLQKGKLTSEEKLKFEKALHDMAIDLCDGGLNPGLYNYIKTYFCSLSIEEYKFKYHNILEYLLKNLKENIASQL